MGGFQIIIGSGNEPAREPAGTIPNPPRPRKAGLFDFLKKEKIETKANLDDLFGDYSGFKTSKVPTPKLPVFDVVEPEKKKKLKPRR